MTHADARAHATHSAYSPDSDRDQITGASLAQDWNLVQRIGFRFLFIYVLLYTYPGPLEELPFLRFLSTPTTMFWRVAVPWVGAQVLHLSHPVSLQPSGSGDKVFDWVQVAAMLMLSALVTIAWTAADRRSRSYPKLFSAFQIYVRFSLASILFGYGFDKVIPNQFEPTGPIRLTQYVGEASPGGLAWFFLGFSVPYIIFAGAGETLAGILLLFRRTATLGAIVGAAVLTNVFMLNMSYDIPVKQYSGHLLLMCVMLVAFDAPRLLNVFIRQRTAEAPRFTELFSGRNAVRAAQLTGALFGVWMIYSHVTREVGLMHQFGRLAPRSPLYGIFEVETVVTNGVTQPPLMTDSSRWHRVAVSGRRAAIRMATDSLVQYRLATDTVKHVATFTAASDSTKKSVLAYAFADADHLVLRGRTGADSVEMTLRRRHEDSYLLVNRGFHWINEAPNFR